MMSTNPTATVWTRQQNRLLAALAWHGSRQWVGTAVTRRVNVGKIVAVSGSDTPRFGGSKETSRKYRTVWTVGPAGRGRGRAGESEAEQS